MSILYADPSALVRAYLADEPDHAEVRALLLSRRFTVVTSEIARLEIASAIHAATRARRLRRARALMDQIDVGWVDGFVTLLRLEPDKVLPHACELAGTHDLGALDALHLSIAILYVAEEADDDLVFVTRDRRQTAAARALGLQVA